MPDRPVPCSAFSLGDCPRAWRAPYVVSRAVALTFACQPVSAIICLSLLCYWGALCSRRRFTVRSCFHIPGRAFVRRHHTSTANPMAAPTGGPDHGAGDRIRFGRLLAHISPVSFLHTLIPPPPHPPPPPRAPPGVAKWRWRSGRRNNFLRCKLPPCLCSLVAMGGLPSDQEPWSRSRWAFALAAVGESTTVPPSVSVRASHGYR